MSRPLKKSATTSGEFTSLAGERYYAIHNVDKMAPFFVSVISDRDHWLFVSSTGGLTAGRVSPESALFPYVTVDKIHDSAASTGSKTLIRVIAATDNRCWEPFNREHDDRFNVSRHLYKNVIGNKIRFEEINHDLRLAYRYTWGTSDRYGFIRHCEVQNLGVRAVRLELIDGLQNILPAGTPLLTQTNSSNLVDAYKWSELDVPTGLAFFTLYSGISDRAEPCESLKANSVFCLGLEPDCVLLSSEQLDRFRQGEPLRKEVNKRGIRGAYLVHAGFELAPGASRDWSFVANVEQSQGQCVELRKQLGNPARLAVSVEASMASGTDNLSRIVGSSDGFQQTAEENVTAHHYANTIFNILRGGIFDNQYRVSSRDFAATVRLFNRSLFQRHQELLENLPDQLDHAHLMSTIKAAGDTQLERLCLEYLPITFGRRHGDPSRPWNRFEIKLKNQNGERLISYQGNWRDIFQNWEALTFSFPEFIESVVAKFVNASTMDGYNPYRITKEGIDWEVEEPGNPWSYIGYWGDHQIIYLLKLLELSSQFHPGTLGNLLHLPIFSYANVPYRIKPLTALLADAKRTVDFDENRASQIERRVAEMGADGKLVPDNCAEVYQVNLIEKLLVPLLSKLGNLVIDGGIWLNTQRPEWNDANNALVGHGLSMVTVYYLRRYVRFLQELFSNPPDSTRVSVEVGQWLAKTATALAGIRPMLGGKPLDAQERFRVLLELGEAASQYRETVYERDSFKDKIDQPMGPVRVMLDDALAAIDHTIFNNRREDGLYHAYNLLSLKAGVARIDTLYLMLEGQVALLSSGAIEPAGIIPVLEALFESGIYRSDQKSFMLYPDRRLPGFLEKNLVTDRQIKSIPLLEKLLRAGDETIVMRDADGCYRFNADFTNIGDLDARLEVLSPRYGNELEAARGPIRDLYEQVFDHRSFTGRSGGMFGFEGLGCIYWHMVAKLLLAVGENFFAALENGADEATCHKLGQLYYRVREGIGFNKTPSEFGAFPMDPYSHTPKHAGAQQPGMTGQVKEELLARFMELGVRVKAGAVSFVPALLRGREFATQAREFRYPDVAGEWRELLVPEGGLAFTWCQTPVIMRLDDESVPSLTTYWDDDARHLSTGNSLSREASAELFRRSGRIRRLELVFRKSQLLTAD